MVQRLVYGLLLHHHSVNIISTELTTKGFLDQMESLDYPIKRNLMDGSMKFIPVFPLIGRTKMRSDFLSRLTTTPGLYDSEVVMIDTFSALVTSEIHEGSALSSISFFKKIIGRNKTLVLTIDPMELSKGIFGPFRAVADILLELKTDIVEGAVEHTLYVTRYSHEWPRRALSVSWYTIKRGKSCYSTPALKRLPAIPQMRSLTSRPGCA